MSVNRQLRQIADPQQGYFTSRQALAAGYSNALQAYHAKSGHWLRVDRGLYRLENYPDTLESDPIRWSLWADGNRARRAVVSHESALHYYGLSAEAERPRKVHLTVSQLRSFSGEPGCVLHLEKLQAQDYEAQPGFRVTTPRKTLQTLRPDLTYTGRWAETISLAQKKHLLDDLTVRDWLRTGVAALPVVADTELSAVSERRPALVASAYDGWRQATAAEVKSMDGSADLPLTAPKAGRLGGVMVEETTMRRLRMEGAGGGLMRAGSSFTLVEMLVVIAIIGILASLLMPALQKALKSSRAMTCSNSLKQNASAMHMYVSDNSGFFPLQYRAATPNYTNEPQYWMTYYQNIKTPKQSTLWCPEDTRTGGARNDGSVGHPLFNNADGSHSIQCSYITHSRSTKISSGIFNSSAIGPAFSAASCRTPSVTLLICEGSGAWYKSMWDGNFVIFHNGATNFSFVDGHVSTVNIGVADGTSDKFIALYPQDPAAHPMWNRY